MTKTDHHITRWTAIVRIGTPHHLDSRPTCHRRLPSIGKEKAVADFGQSSSHPAVHGDHIPSRMLGWIGATHFLLEPIDGDVPGMFAELRCTDDDVSLRSGLPVPPPRFLVLTPWYVWPDYQVVLDDDFVEHWASGSRTTPACSRSSPST